MKFVIKKALFIVLAMLGACQPYRVNSRGNLLISEEVKSFRVGVTNMSEVLKECGTPSLHQDNLNWLYVGAISEETAFQKTKLKNRSIIKLVFSADGILREIKELDFPSNDEIVFDEEMEQLVTEDQVKARFKK